MRFLPIPVEAPRIDPERVRRALGGPRAVPERQEGRFQRLVGQVLEACQPRGKLAVASLLTRSDSQTAIEGEVVFSGQGITALLRNCEAVGAFVVTIGPHPEKMMQACTQSGQLMDLTLLDAIASEAAEDLAVQAQAFVERLVQEENRAATRRFSPGYCDWDLSQQREVDRLVGFEDVGVTLNPALIMVPEKSVSAVVGIGPIGSAGRRLEDQPMCSSCPKRDGCPGPQPD